MASDPDHAFDPNNRSVFRVRNLTKTYLMGEVPLHALRGVDLDLYTNELVVLLGASGSGKSTLLNILGGLDDASSGTVQFLNHDLIHASNRALTDFRRQHVGFVFQFYNLIPSLTALENVAIVTEISPHPIPPDEALERVGLSHRKNHFPAQLSGGEQQRVAIARAIAKRPSVLFCDEPTGALDSATGCSVLEVIERTTRELGATTVVITHNEVIGQMADRIIHISDGQISQTLTNSHRTAPRDLHW